MASKVAQNLRIDLSLSVDDETGEIRVEVLFKDKDGRLLYDGFKSVSANALRSAGEFFAQRCRGEMLRAVKRVLETSGFEDLVMSIARDTCGRLPARGGGQ